MGWVGRAKALRSLQNDRKSSQPPLDTMVHVLSKPELCSSLSREMHGVLLFRWLELDAIHGKVISEQWLVSLLVNPNELKKPD